MQARSPGKGKAGVLAEMIPKIAKTPVPGQCLSLLDEEGKTNLESKMEKAFLAKPMRPARHLHRTNPRLLHKPPVLKFDPIHSRK